MTLQILVPKRPSPHAAALAIVLAVAAIAATPGSAAARPLSPDDVARVQAVISAQASPDGTMAAYVVAVPRSPHDDKDGRPRSELRVARTGEPPRTWVRDDGGIGQVGWSPDGSRIGFVAKRGDDKAPGIWSIAATGGEAVRLVSSETGVARWDWAPDGRAVYFVEEVPKTADEKKRAESGFDQEIYEESWPRRRLMRAEIPVALDAPGATAEPFAELPGQPFQLAVARSGKYLAVALAPTTLIDDEYMAQAIYWIDVSSKMVTGPVVREGKLGPMAFSADSKYLAFVAGKDLHDPEAARLWTVRAGNLDARMHLEPREADVAALESLASGGFLLLTEVGTHSRVERWLGPGRDATPVYEDAATHVRHLSASKRGDRVLVGAETPKTPSTAWWLNIDTGTGRARGELSRIEDLNPWLAEVDLAAQEEYSWIARDGREIRGVLTRPLQSPSGPAPLIVYVHGGPESNVHNAWLTAYSIPGQVAAGRGYMVLAPNYRGSTGRGHEYVTSSQGDAGGAEFDDVLDGIRALIDSGEVDAARVGITGGSYGGFMTAWASTRHSEVFAAGVMFVGISDQIAKFGTTDIPNESKLVHWLTNPYERRDLYVERSPLSYAANAQTPLLILHGKKDTRVDPGQSRELYRALEQKGDVPVRLVLYPNEGHGNRAAAARYDYHLRMLRWFDHYLAPGADRDAERPPSDVTYPAPPGESK